MLDDPNRDPIEVLADRFMHEHRDGRGPSIHEFATKYPEYSQDIIDLFPMILDLERLKEADEKSAPRPATAGTIPQKTLGDFQILREIGRGGMGIVYLARQKSLGRSVALKVLSKTLSSSPQQIERFHQEAEAAAGLHHTNIVPVYGVGQQEDFHYYAMQWIDGIGLDQVIAELADDSEAIQTNPQSTHSAIRRRLSDSGKLSHASYFRNVAGIAADIAAALVYAHQHNVLHRDVKPSNVLLDHAGDAWITDFGLAKLAEDRGLTQTGELIGTLRYMAPEQLEGQVDARSDIYSLGLTLYELLTLQAAFNEPQQAKLLSQRTRATVASPRSLNPQIPRDLETIVLTACATEPQHRYPSADQLADDLHRFLEGRPIQARRISRSERLWRWCRRNPAIAATSAMAVGLLLTVAVVSAVAYFQTSFALLEAQDATTQAQLAKLDADRARNDAEENLRLAIEAFDSILDNITARGLPQSLGLELGSPDQPPIQSTLTDDDAELLRQLLAFYQKFADQNANDVELSLRILSAHQRIARIQIRLEQLDNADQSLQTALTLAETMLERHPDQLEVLRIRIRVINDMGELAYLTEDRKSRPGPGFEKHRQVVSEYDSLPESLQEDTQIRFQLARAYDLMGSTMFRTQLYAGMVDERPGPPGSPPRPRNERDSRRPRPAPPGRTPRPNAGRDPGNTPWRMLEDTFRRMQNGAGPLKGPLPDIETAIELLQPLVEAHPSNREFASLYAKTLQHRYVFLLNVDDRRQATTAFLEAEKRIRQLTRQQPDNPQLLMDLADHLSTVSVRATELPAEQAEKKLLESIQLCENFCRQFPNVPEYHALLASAHRNLSRILMQQQQTETARQHLGLAREQLHTLTQTHPFRFYQWSLAITLIEQSRLIRDENRNRPHDSPAIQEAIVNLKSAIEICEMAEAKPSETGRRLIGQAHQMLAELYDWTGQKELAAQARKLGTHHGRLPLPWGLPGLIQRPPDSPEPRQDSPSENEPRRN